MNFTPNSFPDEINRVREAHGHIKPHIMGPKNFSSSGSALTAYNPALPRTDTTDQGFVMLDTTAVVYSELLAMVMEKLQIDAWSWYYFLSQDTTEDVNSSFEKPASEEEQIYIQLENCGSWIIKRSEVE